MARLSKSHHFKIFEDTGIPTPPGNESDPFNETTKSSRPSWSPSVSDSSSSSQNDLYPKPYSLPSDADADDEGAPPRDSLTSVSSFPESTSHSQRHNVDYISPPPSPQKFFTPQIIRPSFRRPESVRRMQMSSPRQSILRSQRSSRSGTPRSEYGRGSPRGRRRITEEFTSDEEGDGREHPLVLLHVTLLPINLPWSMESMQELLPPQVLENLLLLRSKVSETVLHRGILIPHPRGEYEMLEERLLEALELKEERLTKCGHFRGRTSDSSQASSSLDTADSDSGLGSSESSAGDGEVCTTCKHHLRCPAGKTQKWSVKVFAANGLMRASAWAAAWDGMESVDVEILPWIGEDEGRKLDAKREEERSERIRKYEEERLRETERRETMLVPQGMRLLEGQNESEDDFVQHSGEGGSVAAVADTAREPPRASSSAAKVHDLPPIYRPSQIPLSVLLRNYVYVLAQDRRIVAVFSLSVLAIFFAIRSIWSGYDPALTSVEYSTPLESFHVMQEGMGQEGQTVPEMEHQEEDGPGVLESVVETISGILADEDEALLEVEDQGMAPPVDDGGAVEKVEVMQESVVQDGQPTQEMDSGREDVPSLFESVAETISQMLGDEDVAFFEDDRQMVAPPEENNEENNEANDASRPELPTGEMGEMDDMLE